MSNSQSAIALATRGEAQHKGSKHFDVKFHATRDHVDQNEIEILFCPTQDQLTNGMTKPLSRDQFKSMTSNLALVQTSILLNA